MQVTQTRPTKGSLARNAPLLDCEIVAVLDAVQDAAQFAAECRAVTEARDGTFPRDWHTRILPRCQGGGYGQNPRLTDLMTFSRPPQPPLAGQHAGSGAVATAAVDGLEVRFEAATRASAKAKFLQTCRQPAQAQQNRQRNQLNQPMTLSSAWRLVAEDARVASSRTSLRNEKARAKCGNGSSGAAQRALGTCLNVDAAHRQPRQVQNIAGFTKRLVNGVKCRRCKGNKEVDGQRCVDCSGRGGTVGIMRATDDLGRTHELRPHQVDGVRQIIAHPERPVKIFLWDPVRTGECSNRTLGRIAE